MSKPIALTVRRYGGSPDAPYVVDYRVAGHRRRLSFRTPEEAASALERVKDAIAQGKADALLLPDRVRYQAMEAVKILKPFRVTLIDAARFYARHNLASSDPPHPA